MAELDLLNVVEPPSKGTQERNELLMTVSEYPLIDANENTSTRNREGTLGYWKTYFADCESTPFPVLPPVTKDPVVDSTVEHHLPRLMHPAEEWHATESTILCTAWSLIAGQMTASKDVTFGVAMVKDVSIDEREESTVPDIHPMRLKLESEADVLAYLSKAQQQVLEGTQFEQVKLSEIISVSGDARQACMFQTLLVIRAQKTCLRQTTPTNIGKLQHYRRALVIEILPGPENITARANFDSKVIQHSLVERLLERLGHVALQLKNASPEKRVADIETVTTSDLEDIWRYNHVIPTPVERCVHEAIESLALTQPSAPAICAWDGELTYYELDRLSSNLSRLLAKIGVGPDILVPLCFEKSMWTPVAMLGVLKAGGAFVLLDPNFPEKRLQHIVRQVSPNVFLSSTANQNLSLRLAHNVLIINSDTFTNHDTLKGDQKDAVIHHASPASTAYVVFTSGSTGTPKGVKITHGNIASAFLRKEHLFGCTVNSRIYDLASYSFTAALSNFFAALAVGGCLCIPNDQDRTANISHSFLSLQSNTVILTPSMATTLSPDQMKGLRLLILTGEVVRMQDIQRWWGHTRLLSVYGNSECGGCVTINDSASSPQQLASAGIGKGAGAVTWVVDPDNHHQILPPGCIGELLIESPIVSPGYLINSMTEAFVQAPAWMQRGTAGYPGRNARLYKTGDLVHRNGDGTLKYVGRKDSQIKIRGQRIELGDVEYTVQDCLSGATKVIAELIIPQGDEAKPTLAAFLEMNNRELFLEEENHSDATVFSITEDVETRLSEELPSHMIPSVFFSVQRMPMTATGKINRRKLRQIGSQFSIQQLVALRTSSREGKRQPLTEAEQKMQQLWAQVLGLELESIGLNDSFFLLGGDSIDAIKLIGIARKAGIQDLTVADIFRHPKLGGLVTSHKTHATSTEEVLPFSLLDTSVEPSHICEEVAVSCDIDPSVIEDIYPCSPLQEGLMSLNSRKAGDYINQSVLQLRDDVDEDAFRTAWDTIVRSTPVLRTRIVQTSKFGLLQAVITEDIQWIEAEGLEQYLRQDKCSSMEVGEPLVRYALVREPRKRWFVWTIHHSLYDGWSLPLIIDAVRKLYNGEIIQERARFLNFINYLCQTDQRSAAAFWQNYLSDCQAMIFPSLPATVQQPVADMTIQHQCQPLPKAGTGMTTSTLIRSAWAIIFARYTGSDDVVFGSIISGRNTPVSGIEAMIGPTIANVPVRARVGDRDVLTFLEEMQRQMTEMIPFEQTGLQNISKMGPDAQHACRFQTLIVIQPEAGVVEKNKTLGAWHHHSELQDFATYALSLQCTLATKGVHVTASFDSRVIERWRVERMLRQFSFVMQQLAEVDSSTRIADLDVLTQEDRQQLWEWNRDVPPVVERCIHDLFAEQARVRPGAPAICAWDGEMTYGELDDLSSRLAGHLSQRGVKREEVVPVCFEKSMWTAAAMLAVLKAGGAFLLLDPSLPAERLALMCRKACSRHALASAECLPILKGLVDTIIVTNKQSTQDMPQRKEQLPLALPTSTAYVIFTSGSTGEPKGCTVEHRSSCSAVTYQGPSMQVNGSTRMLQFGSYSFAGCLVEMLHALIHGGCICIPSEEERRSSLASAMSRMAVNWAFLTPTVLDTIGGPESVPPLATLCIGGEPIRASQIQLWESCVHLRQTYGSSETAGVISSARLTGASTTKDVGKARTAIYWIVDPNDHNRLAPLGAAGELLVEGLVLGREYIGEIGKTAVTFVQAPVWRQSFNGSETRLYKTGDLARYKDNGSIELLGRKDTQVKLRGQRIELGEIEHQARLSDAVGVKGLAVELIRPESREDMLACFIAVEKSERGQEKTDEALPASCVQAAVQTIQERLERFLPQYMVPALFVSLAQLPKTSSQKVDRKRLREMGASFTAQQLAKMRASSQGPKRQPTTEAQRNMQQLWGRVLDVEANDIGLEDSFFRLGGDSIAAMKLVGEARRAGVQISMAELFRHPKLVDLTSAAIHLDASSYIPIPRVDHVGPVEQSFAQGRLWFMEELHPGLDWYLMPFAVRIRGPLQLAALNAALHGIERRHETLRTTFATSGGVSVQMVLPFRAKELTVVDLAPGDEHSRLQTIREKQMVPFDLRTEPGWRVSVYRLYKDEHVLSIVMHHIVSDGWSVDVLTRELATCYSASLHGQDPLSQLRPLAIQYRDFSMWQRQQAQIDEHEKQVSYWVTQLQTSRPAELFCDKPRPGTLSGKADIQTLNVGVPLYTKLQQFCKARGVTLFVALLAVFRATHFRLTGQNDATIGTVNANRDRWELRDMIGFFVNMQCLRTTVEDETFEELIQQVQAVVVASLASQDVPFESIVSKLKGDRDLSRNPLAQVVFVVHSQRDLGQLTLEGMETEVLHNVATSRFDLEFHFFQRPDSLQGNVVFSTDLYLPETIDNMLSVFNSVLEGCLKEPTARIASLPLLTEADHAKLDEMGLIRVEETPYPREMSIVDLFRQQASAHPSRVAVKDSREQMTYAELDRASDILAGWLAKRSLAPETLVGVFASRCCQTIVAFLGIMKANLAYLPFDVKIPGKRMEAILSSLPGQMLIFVGADVQPPNIDLSNVKFLSIAEALDEQANDRSASRRSDNITGPSATSLACVMFTSGSTGQPKGVMVEHRGIVRLAVQNNLVQHLPVTPVIAHMTSIAFDVSTWEIYTSLMNGGTLLCIDTMTMLDPVAMLQIAEQSNLQAVALTPTLFKQYIVELPAVIAALSVICVGGEALHPREFYAAKRILQGKLINCYGPTENTGYSTIFALTQNEECTNGVPIGRALSNSGAYVMDAKLQLVPLGIVGELVVTGDGVARGYTDPARDVDRFVSVVISGETVKAYRTGDYVRHRPTDGQLEFFGRIDGQVKLRGQRIELAEIEHVLRSHQAVGDAVVVLQHCDVDGDAQLAGFVTIREDAAMADGQDEEAGDDDETQHVDVWEEQFDAKIYSSIDQMRPETIGRDFIGWTSMYDGSEIDKAEMNEWLDDTIATLLNGGRPGRVLEIGSGTGMILFNLSDGLQSYVGLDPSRDAVEFVARTAESIPALTGKVHMHKATAVDVGQLKGSITANLAIMNSVVQYFPSQEYLFKVVRELLAVEGMQTLFFGDIRSHALYREFLATRALHMAGNTASKADIRRMVADMGHVEREFLVDPAFFTSLPGRLPDLVEHVEILPKKLKATNELSCYRYAAVVHVKSKGRQEQEIRRIGDEEWIDFVERGLDRQTLQQELNHLSSSLQIAICNIPYSKTIVSRCFAESLDDTAGDALNHQDWLSSVHQDAKGRPSLSATDLLELAQEADCRVEISWSRQHSQHGGLDAVFHKYQPKNGTNRVLFQFPTDHAECPLHSLSNKPMRQQVLQKTQQQLQEMLRAQLPTYMVPDMITILDAMPVNRNGKVDRSMLSQWKQEQTAGRGPVLQPGTEMERTLQHLWARVLNIDADSIGLDHSFFRLGGDSIAAMKLVGEARKEEVSISVADIFRNPKLASLARLMLRTEHLQQQSYTLFSLLSTTEKQDLHAVMPVLPHDGQTDNIADILPATHMQQWFISTGIGTPRAAHNYIFIDLGTIVNVSLLRQSCYALLQHFPILRTLFVFLRDRLWQVVLRDLDLPFTEVEFDTSLEEGSRAICLEDREVSSPSALPTKFILACNSARKYRLVLRLSHAQYDGVCIPVIVRTLLSIYQQESLSPLPSFSTYLTYARDRQLISARYWRELLKGSHMTNVTSKLRPKAQDDGAPRKIQIEHVIRMPTIPPDITMASLVSAAWAKVLCNITGEEDVVYGHVVAGRNSNIPGVMGIVGPCVNIVPVRARVSSTRTSTELVRSIQEQYVSLGESDSMDFDELVRKCTDWPPNTKFYSTLQHQNIDEHPEIDFNGVSTKVGWFENPYWVFDRLAVVSYPQADTLKLVVAGNTAISTPANAKMVLQMLCETIREISNEL